MEQMPSHISSDSYVFCAKAAENHCCTAKNTCDRAKTGMTTPMVRRPPLCRWLLRGLERLRSTRSDRLILVVTVSHGLRPCWRGHDAGQLGRVTLSSGVRRHVFAKHTKGSCELWP